MGTIVVSSWLSYKQFETLNKNLIDVKIEVVEVQKRLQIENNSSSKGIVTGLLRKVNWSLAGIFLFMLNQKFREVVYRSLLRHQIMSMSGDIFMVHEFLTETHRVL